MNSIKFLFLKLKLFLFILLYKLKVIKKESIDTQKNKLGDLRYKKSIFYSDYKQYTNYVLNNQLDKSKFVELSKDKFERKESDPKLISFYLPQFYPFPENDKWYGKGFTEWTNTNKAVPQYVGHYQPRLPIDVGYYSLKDTDVMTRQIELAKQYGIFGFCFYYYWFSGDTLMRKPVENFLNDKSLNMPFCLFWANENWSKLWDAGNRELLYEQKLENGDAERFMEDILPFMKDDRYIQIDKKPLLIIYRPKIFSEEIFLNFTNTIREIAKKNGFEDLYLIAVKRDNIEEELKNLNIDAAVEFYPNDIYKKIKRKKEKIINDKFVGKVFDMDYFIEKKQYIYDTNYKLFKGCFPNWDNTARKCYSNAMIFQSSPKQYETWLSDIVNWTKINNSSEEQFIFVNAWNEWAEAAYLEPDQKYGYAYLQATKNAIEKNRK